LRLTILLALPVMLIAAACGGGDDSGPNDDEAAETTAAETPTPVIRLPTPKPAEPDTVVLTVVRAKESYTPTFAEFRALPATEIDADGKKSGVALTALAARVGAGPNSVVTIEGRGATGIEAYFRGKLSDAAASTAILSIDDQGLITLYGSAVPKEQWLNTVVGISFAP
jgi:ABC-type glycerol-3-phosphate transport system substrate-binding protein